MIPMRRLGVVLFVLVIGCAPVDRPLMPHLTRSIIACPHDGGLAWLELTSPNFVLRTTQQEAMARADVQGLEDLLVGFKAAVELLLPAGPNPSRTSVILFTDDWQFHSVVPVEAAGQTRVRDERGRPVVLVQSGNTVIPFRHELIHRLMLQRIRSAPPWLHEGLAEYLSMLSVEKGTAMLGLVTSRQRRLTTSRFDKQGMPGLLLVDELPSLSELFGDSEQTLESDEKYYIAAWAAVHYLINGEHGQLERFRAFTRDMSRGRDAATALQANYGQLATLERGYRAHLRELAAISPDAHELRVPLAVKSTVVHPNVRWLDDAEVHTLWAFFLPYRADEQLALAQKHDPGSAHTYLLQGMNDKLHKRTASAIAAFDRAAALAPNDRFVVSTDLYEHLELEADKPRAERKLSSLAAAVRRLAESADETPALLIVASYGALGGDAAFALPFAQRAVALDPAAPECEAALAQLYFRTGDFAHAVEAELAAFQRLPQQGSSAQQQAELACYRRAATGEAADCAW